MFGALRDFIRRLGAGEDEHYAPSDTPLALAALLVHSVAIDGVTTDEERLVLRDLLTRHFGLTGDDLDALITEAVQVESDAVDIYRFTSVLKARLSEDERIRVVENLWEIAYADGQSHEFEENLIWRVAELLGVNRRDRIAMKRLVAENRSSDSGDDA